MLAVKTKLSDREKGRQTDNNLSDNKRKKKKKNPQKGPTPLRKYKLPPNIDEKVKLTSCPGLREHLQEQEMGLSLSLGISPALSAPSFRGRI